MLNFSTAPGAYDVEKAEKVIQQSTGAITFGIKYKDPKPDDVPGTFFLTIYDISKIYWCNSLEVVYFLKIK